MRFSDLPLRLRHDVANLTLEKTQRLVKDLQPFAQFCAEQSHGRVGELLDAIAVAFRGWSPGDPIPGYLGQRIDSLADEVALSSLKDVEPGFLSYEITVFTRLDGSQKDRFLALHLDYPLLQEVLGEIFRKQFRLVRNYDRTFRINDLFGCDRSVMISSRDLALKLLDHGFPAKRIVYMDFWETSHTDFRGKLIFPFRLGDLHTVIS